MTGLEADGLTRRYGAVTALVNVGARFAAGTITCVLGASGSGKTTLVRLLHLLETPDEGAVHVNGTPAPMAGRSWLPTLRRFSLVQQRPGLLRSTVIQNVAFPLRARGVSRIAAEEDARRWLRRVGLEDRSDAYAWELSGGEGQRVAVARALVTKPDFLLIDEGTNQLDPRGARIIEGLIAEQAARGATVVLVTHNVPQAMRLADSFILLQAGRMAETGTRQELRQPKTESLRSFLEMG